MLAQVFKTAAELGIPEHERAALIEVLYQIEDGTIPTDEIYMPRLHCGTKHCLAGWAHVIDPTAFPETDPGRARHHDDFKRYPHQLKRLFQFGGYCSSVDPVKSLRKYLETGVPY